MGVHVLHGGVLLVRGVAGGQHPLLHVAGPHHAARPAARVGPARSHAGAEGAHVLLILLLPAEHLLLLLIMLLLSWVYVIVVATPIIVVIHVTKVIVWEILL